MKIEKDREKAEKKALRLGMKKQMKHATVLNQLRQQLGGEEELQVYIASLNLSQEELEHRLISDFDQEMHRAGTEHHNRHHREEVVVVNSQGILVGDDTLLEQAARDLVWNIGYGFGISFPRILDLALGWNFSRRRRCPKSSTHGKRGYRMLVPIQIYVLACVNHSAIREWFRQTGQCGKSR